MKNKRISDFRFKGDLQKLESYVDENDRPQEDWVSLKSLFYAELGVAASEHFYGVQEKSDIVRKISIVYDPILLLDRTNFHVELDGVSYNIQRIYTDIANERMELSLTYAK